MKDQDEVRKKNRLWNKNAVDLFSRLEKQLIQENFKNDAKAALHGILVGGFGGLASAVLFLTVTISGDF